MRTYCRIAIVVILLGIFSGCGSSPRKEPEKPIGINTSDVYRMGQEALQPVADQYVERGDRILLVPVRSFKGSDGWRFVPTPLEIPQDVFEGRIRPGARNLFKPPAGVLVGESREVALLNAIFRLDAARKVYILKTDGEKYDELLLGRILAGVGYSGVETFDVAEFSRRNPYFIDSLESGMLAAVLKKGKGFERLQSPAISDDALKDHQAGKLVFGTSVLRFATWKELQDANKPVQKLLMYSVDNVISAETEYIGFNLSFRLVDVARGGRVLWNGTKTMSSKDFPRQKVPFLGTLRLTLPPQVAGAQRDAFSRTLRDQGVKMPMNAVFVKIDDIPVFGTYPVTREDFAVENALQELFSSISGVNVMEKLFKRQYKEPWQVAHAVHYVNPLLSGDYAEFQNYYGARYMIGYRVLWKKIQGVQLLQGDKDLELSSRILGIYVKVVDMAASGKVVLSDFLTLGVDSELEQNVLYRCYERTKSFTALASALRDLAVINDSTNMVLINRRMEIANDYIGDKAPAESFMLTRLLKGGTPGAPDYVPDYVMRSCYDAYEVLRTFGKTDDAKAAAKPAGFAGKTEAPKTLTPAEEWNLAMAINLMQTWFEDGLGTALMAGNAAPNEKLESLYSRYLIRKASAPKDASEEFLYLSPLLLSQWGAAIKTYYNIDKIVYFSLMETSTPASRHIKTPAGSLLARYFPLVSYEPDSLQVSVVNVISGDYEYKQDFALK
ncbi:MAG: hypothetical protein NT080_04695 [Spirochaetes bacterium]|nr:hypothetical protein [Spirochaetota bacterium]